MKKIFLVLAILLTFPAITNAVETEKNIQPYHPLGCGFTYPCPKGNFTDSAKEVGHYRDSYQTVKSEVIQVNGENYTVLQYSNGTKAVKKGRYWHK